MFLILQFFLSNSCSGLRILLRQDEAPLAVHSPRAYVPPHRIHYQYLQRAPRSEVLWHILLRGGRVRVVPWCRRMVRCSMIHLPLCDTQFRRLSQAGKQLGWTVQTRDRYGHAHRYWELFGCHRSKYIP